MPWNTHEVTNQVTPLTGYNRFTADPALVAALAREGAVWHSAALTREGAESTRPELLLLAEQANRHAPILSTHDACGVRADTFEFHPSWHLLLAELRRAGLHALPFREPRAGAMVARCASYFLHGQVESGTLCPVTMTFASIPVLRDEPALFAALRDKLLTLEHDSRDLPLEHKGSMLVGMGMTEKQGGSDLRGTRTRATPLDGGGRGTAYRLVGHKWFFSVPQADAHLVLARTDAAHAPSCFYVPRFTPDGAKNAVHAQRLKDKLGNRSNASAEVEFLDAYGVMIGAEGRGIPTLVEMANHTRLDCVIGSAALMRAALVEAIHHARERHAFGRALAEQPLMQNVLADLALETEAATLLFMRLARAFDTAAPASEHAWRRIVTPAAKFWVCKRALEFTGEAMEVLGGNGYVETAPLARFYREAPVNSIWEGSGNVMCLDLLRALEREPEGAEMLLAELEQTACQEVLLRQALDELRQWLHMPPEERARHARAIAQRLILVVQATLLLQGGASTSAAAFIASRFGPGAGYGGRIYGTLPSGIDHAALVARAFTP